MSMKHPRKYHARAAKIRRKQATELKQAKKARRGELRAARSK